MKKLKIAYILPYLGVSGGIAVVFQHANRLMKRGHEVIIGSQTPVVSTDWFPFQLVPVRRVDDLPGDLDILVATSWQTCSDVIRLKAKHKCYFVQSDETRFHEFGNDYFHITQLTYVLNFHFLTEAKWIKKWLRDNFNKEAALIPNGIDKRLFFQDTPLKKRAVRKRVLLEGAIDIPFKGMHEAFEVVNDLDVEVWCVSSLGRPKPGWRCDMFFEMMPMDKMRNVYSSCDVLLKMSRVEGFFGPPLEMMACGGICVVSKVTGYDEYIVDGENAIVVDPSDIKGAKEAIKRLIGDEALTEKLKVNGLKTADEWGWEPSIDKLERYFQEIAEGRYGYFTEVQELTNDSIEHFFKKTYAASNEFLTLPHEIIMKKIAEKKIVQQLLTKMYRPLKGLKQNLKKIKNYRNFLFR